MNRINDQNDILDMLETRFKTIMIGSISRFENTFGYLWSHGNDPKNKNEQYFRDLWEDLRIDLLNHGNNQIRLAINDINNFFRKQNQYQYNYKFIFSDDNKGDQK